MKSFPEPLRTRKQVELMKAVFCFPGQNIRGLNQVLGFPRKYESSLGARLHHLEWEGLMFCQARGNALHWFLSRDGWLCLQRIREAMGAKA